MTYNTVQLVIGLNNVEKLLIVPRIFHRIWQVVFFRPLRRSCDESMTWQDCSLRKICFCLVVGYILARKIKGSLNTVFLT